MLHVYMHVFGRKYYMYNLPPPLVLGIASAAHCYGHVYVYLHEHACLAVYRLPDIIEHV